MERLIDPKILAQINHIPLIAKTVAEGFLHGVQASTQRGVGLEFNQYRAYEPGDALNRVDWKLFARSDRYYVREAERESEIDVWFLLDASYSMQQKSENYSEKVERKGKNLLKGDLINQWNKFEYAQHLIATLSYIAQKQGDSIGFCSLSSGAVNFLPSGCGEKHWQKLLISLSKTQPEKFFVNQEKIKTYLERLKKTALIFVISDFNQKNNEITDLVDSLKSSRSEVVALQPICHDEIEFKFKGAVRFKDLETAEEVLVSAQNIKKNYLKNYNHYQLKIKEQLRKNNIAYHQFNIDQPMDQILAEYLKQRHQQKVTR